MLNKFERFHFKAGVLLKNHWRNIETETEKPPT